jgi:hypothetical protein
MTESPGLENFIEFWIRLIKIYYVLSWSIKTCLSPPSMNPEKISLTPCISASKFNILIVEPTTSYSEWCYKFGLNIFESRRFLSRFPLTRVKSMFAVDIISSASNVYSLFTFLFIIFFEICSIQRKGVKSSCEMLEDIIVNILFSAESLAFTLILLMSLHESTIHCLLLKIMS